MKPCSCGQYLHSTDEIQRDSFINVTVGIVEGQNLHDLLNRTDTSRHIVIDYLHLSCTNIFLFSGQVMRWTEPHLLAGQGSAGLNKGPCIHLSLFPSLQQLNCLDEGLQCGHSAPCLQASAPQPLLQQTHIIA